MTNLIKQTLRSTYRHRKDQLLQNNIQTIKNGLKQQLADLLSQLQTNQRLQNKVIGSYIADLVKELKPPYLQGFEYAYPRFEKTKRNEAAPVMQFKVVKDINIISEAIYGIKVPSSFLETVYPSLVLVPLMCFHPIYLHRIGYGGGYYDRYIQNTRRSKRFTVFVGVAAQQLQTEQIFWDDHDKSLDFVLTESKIY